MYECFSLQFDVSGKLTAALPFTITSKKPVDLRRSYVLNAVLNIGWQRKTSSPVWIKEGDFASASVPVAISKESNDYIQNIAISCYGKIKAYHFLL